ncbi:MAG: CHAT domain-containing protein, partial [Cyanobacteria bacterium P01_A01_bin.114]
MNFVSQAQGAVRLSVFAWAIWSLVGIDISQAQVTSAPDGTGTRVTPHGNHFDIEGGTRAGSNLFHSFEQFDLDAGQLVDFRSGADIQNILGRIVGGEASSIDGLIQITGSQANLYLINSAGILFGPNAALNVPAAFTATTADRTGFESGWLPSLGDADYSLLTGAPVRFDFTQQASGSSEAILVNQGNLFVGQGQSLSLLGHRVLNTGQLVAPGGNITVAASAGQLQMSQPGSLLSLAGPISERSLMPTSLPSWLTGASFDHASAISVGPGGQIQLSGAELPPGAVQVSGRLATSGQVGGQVQVLGQTVGLVEATVDASGLTSGGTALIGGDYQGVGLTPTAAFTWVDRGSQVSADAQWTGNAGQVVVWADVLTQFLGQISARGGAQGGDGGQVEISGKESLVFDGRVDLSAVRGEFGTLLFDPLDIEIRSGAGADTNQAILPTVLSNEPGSPFVIYETTLEGLAGDANVILQATNDITVQDLADDELTFRSGTGTLTFLADADSNGVGQFVMADQNDVLRASGRSVSISGASITTGTIDTSISALGNNSEDGGNITLSATNGELQTQNLFASSRASSNNAGEGGTVTLNAGGDIDTGRIETVSFAGNNNAGNGGDITIRSTDGSISTGYLYSTSLSRRNNAEEAGDISIDAPAGSITTGFILATAEALGNDNAGAGGDVFLSSLGDIQVDFIHTDSHQAAGVIDVSTQQNFRVTQTASNLENTSASLSAVGGSSGMIDIEYSQDGDGLFTVGDSSINGTQGTVIAGETSLTVLTALSGDVENDSIRITNGAVILGQAPEAGSGDSGDDINNGNSSNGNSSNGNSSNGNSSSESHSSNNLLNSPETSISSQSGSAQETPLAQAANETQLVSLASETQNLTRIRVPVVSTHSDDDSAADEVFLQGGSQAENEAFWRALESSMSEAFSEYLQLSTPVPETSLKDVTQVLSEIKSDSGINPALVYAYFENEQLELMVITAKGLPIRYRVEGATRDKVEQVSQTFLQSVTNPVLRPAQYLPPAQQLYEWLIAPLSKVLQAENIQSLSFILDPGLRSLPLAALHDGENFLVESYSIGLMPTFGLTDLRQLPDQQLEDISVLGMGISDFQDQVDLFAVPAELENITQDGGVHFLNEAATLKNLQTQLQAIPFDVLHIATHAMFEPGARENSYLQLWDQQLQLSQIRNLDLAASNVALIVLSACTTALGDKEAEFGFAGFAVNAGAQSALASLWSVSDEATLGFMTLFYQQLEQTS